MKQTKIYQGKILGLSTYEGEIEGRQVKREIIEHRGAAAILGFDEHGMVILVRQHRFPHGYVLEIPAGTLEPGEDPLDCAFREFTEETGYKAEEMTPLISYYPSIGYNSEIIHCFVATSTTKVADLKLDDDEILNVTKLDIKDIHKMIISGEIQDSKTICAVLTYMTN